MRRRFGAAWNSKLPEIMDPVLPVLPIWVYLGIVLGTFRGPGGSAKMSSREMGRRHPFASTQGSVGPQHRGIRGSVFGVASMVLVSLDTSYLGAGTLKEPWRPCKLRPVISQTRAAISSQYYGYIRHTLAMGPSYCSVCKFLRLL